MRPHFLLVSAARLFYRRASLVLMIDHWLPLPQLKGEVPASQEMVHEALEGSEARPLAFQASRDGT